MKIAVLVSGSGTNLAAMIKRRIPIGLVLADRPCPALQIAAKAGIPTSLLNRHDFGYRLNVGEAWNRKGFTQAVTQTLSINHIELIAMAGFFTVLHAGIFQTFGGRILNSHPSLLPAFKGAHAVEDALQANMPETGTTIHLVTTALDDERYIVAQAKVPIHPDDTVATLWERIKLKEHRLYPQVLHDILSGHINLAQLKEGAS
ncbi:MAG: phosphoribosylglycinamide formyltransferase, formyltetrahydrofolate-dependent [Patescibacteria group bacterium]|nr:phosphoribosylglycinamide formyltransferase, formyltetrahydrofolate-dependent [Patescibacteria group bacterium]